MMYKFLYIFLALICAVNCHCNRRDNCKKDGSSKVSHDRGYHNRLFNDVANALIATDKKIQELCVANSNGATKEAIEQNDYSLTIPAALTDPDIKIRHRVLYINAKKGGAPYVEIRMIPAVVDARKAKYKLTDDRLSVIIPFKPAQDCSGIDDEIITVPKLTATA